MIEELLDQEDVEVDPIDRMDGDTPLHKAIRFVNSLDKADWGSAAALVDLLVEAGADLRYGPLHSTTRAISMVKPSQVFSAR